MQTNPDKAILIESLNKKIESLQHNLTKIIDSKEKLYKAYQREVTKRRRLEKSLKSKIIKLSEQKSLINSTKSHMIMLRKTLQTGKLDGFKLMKEIGEGSSGIVFTAKELNLNRVVALKIFPWELLEEKRLRNQFIREAKILSKMEHPNIVRLYELKQSEHFLFFVTEYIKGTNLEPLIYENMLDLEHIREVIISILHALIYAHSKKIIHKDIKPSNILISDRGEVKLSDFSISEIIKKTRRQPKLFIGTLLYASPEQCDCKKFDVRSDIYSLGMLFYEILAKKHPYGHLTIPAIIRAQMELVPPVLPDIPAELNTLVQTMLRKNPDERYQKTEDILNDFLKIPLEINNSIDYN